MRNLFRLVTSAREESQRSRNTSTSTFKLPFWEKSGMTSAHKSKAKKKKGRMKSIFEVICQSYDADLSEAI
jgi:hypothetical protein